MTRRLRPRRRFRGPRGWTLGLRLEFRRLGSDAGRRELGRDPGRSAGRLRPEPGQDAAQAAPTAPDSDGGL